MDAPMKTPGGQAGRGENKQQCSIEPRQSAMVDTATRKALATLQAEFALTGHAMTWCADDDGLITILVSRWVFAREFDSIEQARAFLRQIGGAR
ncbi:hypothetical protein ACFSCU_17900 [Ottowia beijingensis]